MPAAPIPMDEIFRLGALRDLDVLDTAPEPEFDALVKAAALICGTPISLVSLVDQKRQWFKANNGLPGATETPRDFAFCAHAVLGDSLMEVPDATIDPRFADNPLVTGGPDIRFYAGAPLRLSTGAQVGTLCVIDREARTLTPVQREALSCLAEAAVRALEGRRATRELQAALNKTQFSEASLRLVVDNAPSMLAYWDKDLNCQFANIAYQKCFDSIDDKFIGKNIKTLLGEELYALNKHHIDEVLAGKPQSFERFMTGPDGVLRWCLICYAPNIVEGAVMGFLAQVNDVSALKKVEQSLQEAQRLGRIGSWEWAPQSDTVTWSDELFEILGYAQAQTAPSFAEQAKLYTPESWQRLYQAVDKAMQDGEPYCLELQFIKAGGRNTDSETGWLEARGEAVLDAMQQVVGLRGTVQDITARRLLLDELAAQHELLRVTLQSIGDGVITTDSDGVVTWLNPVAEHMVGWKSGHATGKPLAQIFQVIDEETRQFVANPMEHALGKCDDKLGTKDKILISRNGQEFSIENSVGPIRSESGELLGTVLAFHDVTEQRRQTRKIAYRAQHDSLTGLVNRSEFEIRLERALASAHSQGAIHTLMYIDLDQFKIVNDSCGHAAGDKLLQNVSSLLKGLVRSRDTVARLGGDEFALLIEHCTRQNAEHIGEQICNRLNDYRFVHEGKRFRIGASIGLVPIDAGWETPAAIMQAADQSCYAAKEAGRNRVHSWHEADASLQARQSEMRWATRLENAFDEGRFRLFGQCLAPLKAGDSGHHMEVLLRLEESDGTIIAAGAFFSAAERFNMATRIDRLVLKKVVDLLSGLPDLNGLNTICVNISGQSIGDRAFHREANSILKAAGLAVCQRICLEITETAAITNIPDAKHFIDQVNRLGVRLALDDFGAGAATFGYLKSLPIDILKIDGQFVRDLTNDPLNDAALRCFVDVARIMGVKVVAECVETESVLSRLKEIGVDYAQGYIFHRPEPIENIIYFKEKTAAA